MPEAVGGHAAGIGDLLQHRPEIHLVGVESVRTKAFQLGLSAPVQATLPAAARMVLQLLQ